MMERDEARKLAAIWDTLPIYEDDDGATVLEYPDGDGGLETIDAAGADDAFLKLADATEQIRRLTAALAGRVIADNPAAAGVSDDDYGTMWRAIDEWSGFGNPHRNGYAATAEGDANDDMHRLQRLGLVDGGRLMASGSYRLWHVTADGQALVAAWAMRAALGGDS